jgi:carbohydrate-selective porin OprB
MKPSIPHKGVRKTLHRGAIFLAFITTASVAFSSDASSSTDAKNVVSTNAASASALSVPSLSQWWNGSSALGDLFGIRSILADYGLTFNGQAKETFLGNATPPARPNNAYNKYGTSKGVQAGVNGSPADSWGNEDKIGFNLDLGKKFGLEGVSLESDWRYREVNGSPNDAYAPSAAGTTGNASIFNPDKDSSGMGTRILSQYIQYSSDSKSKDPGFLLKAGWINPYEDFLSQPDSKNFENNAIASSKGIGSAAYGYYQPGKLPTGASQSGTVGAYKVTAVPWSSSYDSWGGLLRAKPSANTYVQTYLGLAIGGYSGVQSTPQNSASYNNGGFNFQGTAPFNPTQPAAPGGVPSKGYTNAPAYYYGQNGVYNVSEVGWTPKFGDAKLEGHYAAGYYIWGQNNNDFGSHSGNATISGLYLQADQRLTAVQSSTPAAPSLSKNPVDSKNPVAPAASSYDKTRGLYSFSEFTLAPASEVSIPLYFQTGLVYKGLFDARPNDKTGIAWGEGFYSQNLNSAINASYVGTSGANGAFNSYKSQNYSTTGVFEYFYDIAINKWLDFVPDAQYIINPSGNGSTVNALVLGATISAKF